MTYERIIRRKLNSTTFNGGDTYVDARPIIELYKTLPKKSKYTMKKMIRELKFDDVITIQLFHSCEHLATGLSCFQRIKNMFKAKDYIYFLEMGELLVPRQGRHQKSHIDLINLILELPNIN